MLTLCIAIFFVHQAERVAAEEAGESDDEEDEEWADELLFESPLDQIDAYKDFTQRLFRAWFLLPDMARAHIHAPETTLTRALLTHLSTEIQANAAPVFEQATGPLSDELKQQLTAIGMLAESEGEAAIKNQSQAAGGQQ